MKCCTALSRGNANTTASRSVWQSTLGIFSVSTAARSSNDEKKGKAYYEGQQHLNANTKWIQKLHWKRLVRRFPLKVGKF